MSDSVKSAYITQFEFGPYIPILRTEDKIVIDPQGIVDYYRLSEQSETCKRLLGEILPDDLIVDAPSLVTPLLLKKRTVWPPKEAAQSSDTQSTCDQANEADSSSDDIQVLKVISRDSSSPDVIIENNPRYRKVEEYIKASVVANLTNGTKPSTNNSILAIQDYSKSSGGELLMSIGYSRVTEFIIQDTVKKVGSKVRKGNTELIQSLETMKTKLAQRKISNLPYKLDYSMTCNHCAFRTESLMVLDGHLEAPHKNSSKFYLCNWCSFRTKDTGQITLHNHVAHKKFRCRIEKPLAIHCCRYCPFESNSKRKFTSHIFMCEQTFQKDSVQETEDQNDYSAITAKFITQQDVRTYESTLKALRLAAYNPHQIKVSSSVYGYGGQPILVLPRPSYPSTTPSNRLQVIPVSNAAAPYADITSVIGRGSAGADKTSTLAQNQQHSTHLMRLLATHSSANNLPQNRTTILQHPKIQSVFVNGMSVVKNAQNIVMAPPSQVPYRKVSTPIDKPIDIDLTADDDQLESTEASCSNVTFVICEICDSYIENLSLFKSHMQWVHKVRIHQKLLESSRPPLNCQKCNWRFFTDQGLERHLLGSHALVTTNMQELADSEKDSGRCTVCGVRCPCKLVAHMKDVHKSNLRPAQLSYKCTVCSANFSLYRHFENHVYRVHTNPNRQTTDK